MLIIFDLDDTLIDTTHCLTQVKLEHAVQRMIEHGLVVPDVSQAIAMLKRLDGSFLSGRQTLQEFIEIIDADPKYFEIGLNEFYGDIPPDIAVNPLEGAADLLTELSSAHRIALVTVGKADLQMLKMKKAGIDSALFSKIIVSETRDKKPHYQAIIRELSVSPREVVVCGDRIPIDLTPAKELGFNTIQMLWGRGLVNIGNKADVDFAITQLSEIKEIIMSLNL